MGLRLLTRLLPSSRKSRNHRICLETSRLNSTHTNPSIIHYCLYFKATIYVHLTSQSNTEKMATSDETFKPNHKHMSEDHDSAIRRGRIMHMSQVDRKLSVEDVQRELRDCGFQACVF
jgi:hypothetical protein